MTNNKKQLYRFVLIALFLVFVFTSSVQAVVIFEDNFDSDQDWTSISQTNVAAVWPDTIQTILNGPASASNLPAWYNYRCSNTSHTLGQPLYVVDGIDPHNGIGKSLKYNIENQSYMNGGSMNVVLYDSGNCGYDDLYIRFYAKFDPNWDFQDGGSMFIKLFRVYSGVDVINDTEGPSSSFATTEDRNNGIKRSMNVFYSIVSDGNEDERLKISYFLGQHQGGDYQEIEQVASTSIFNLRNHKGEWLFVQARTRMNDIGQSNGRIDFWMIPESNISTYNESNPTFSVENVEIRSNPDRHFNALIFLDNMSGVFEGGSGEQTLNVDDLVVSTTPIGPLHINQFRADVDNNSQINTTDAMLTLRNSLGLDMSGTNWQTSTTTGDADCDGDTDSTDAMLILRYSLGLDMSGTGWCV